MMICLGMHLVRPAGLACVCKPIEWSYTDRRVIISVFISAQIVVERNNRDFLCFARGDDIGRMSQGPLMSS